MRRSLKALLVERELKAKRATEQLPTWLNTDICYWVDGWYHRTEDEDLAGPYSSSEEAKQKMAQYFAELNTQREE